MGWTRREPALTAAALAAGVVLMAACAEESSPEPGADRAPEQAEASSEAQESFRASLHPLNGSRVEGEVILSLLGSTLRVQVTATGLEPRQEHVQHIHRLDTGEAGACPTQMADEDDDGMLSLDESLSAYGPVGLKLAPFPRADRRGRISFQGTLELPPELEPVTDRVIAVYGLDSKRVYDPTVPVACGRIR